MTPERYQTVREICERCLPGEFAGEPREYRFFSPWLFVRADLFRGAWLDPWYREAFGYSRNRLFRDSWIRNARRAVFSTGVDCIRVKRVSVRYFDRAAERVCKVLASEDAGQREKLARHVEMREKFSAAVSTIPILASGEDFYTEPITSGHRVLEQDFLRSPEAAGEFTRVALAIAGVEPVREEEGLLSAGSHGDLMIHNLFWSPEEKGFIVIDWEAAGRGPLLWDSFLFFLVLLKKKAVRRSGALLARFDAVAAEHFRRMAESCSLDSKELERQWEACVSRYNTNLGAGDRDSYGDDRVDKDLGRLKAALMGGA